MELITVIIGQNCERFLDMCIKAVKKSDKLIYCDGGSTDNSINITVANGAELIENKYDQEDKGMNGKQRNFYLKYLKENYPNDWALCIDADEIVEDIEKIKEFIKKAEHSVYSIKMRHLIQDLAHEDSTVPTHFVLNRLFKISEVDKYPEVEHPVLMPKNQNFMIGTDITTIWHLAYIPNLWEIKRRYDNHLKKSNMHTPEFLRKWYFDHLFGTYSTKRFNAYELPDIILNEFGITKDEMYVIGRTNMEVKHYQDAINWKEFFHPKKVYIFGCGVGQRVYTLNKLGIDTFGWDINEYSVKQKVHENVAQMDITKDMSNIKELRADLVVAYDVLEHLEYSDLDKAIDNMIKSSNKFILISIPVLGNPALDIDATHKIKESEEWWISQFTKKGLKQVKTPEHFLYKEQIYIFKK